MKLRFLIYGALTLLTYFLHPLVIFIFSFPVDYVSKWVEAIATLKNDAKIVKFFLHKNIFTRFGSLRAIISDKGSHFYDKVFATLMAKYGVKHRKSLAYHSQENGQAEISNHELKSIFEKMVNTNKRDWSSRLDYSL